MGSAALFFEFPENDQEVILCLLLFQHTRKRHKSFRFWCTSGKPMLQGEGMAWENRSTSGFFHRYRCLLSDTRCGCSVPP
jgi:hypothetical protein